MNFLVWRQGLRGPIASLDLFDPRQSSYWKIIEQSLIEIVSVPESEREFTLDQAIAAHPCKEIA